MPTPPDYAGWERSSVLAWEAVENQGGIVPDIEEDRSHAPPAWWRYPSPLRSAELLAWEAKDPKGLYTRGRAGRPQGRRHPRAGARRGRLRAHGGRWSGSRRTSG